MNRFALFRSAVILSTFAAVASAGATTESELPFALYRQGASHALTMCQIALSLANATAKGIALGRTDLSMGPDTDYMGCISKGKVEVKPKLEAALKATKKAGAKAALRSYHVAFVTAIDGIEPGLEERVINYEQRQQALKEKMTEAWARVEVEQ